MGLLVTNNLDVNAYLDSAFGSTNKIVPQGVNPPSPCVCYLDRDDRIIGHTEADSPVGVKSTIWDPNLVDKTSARIADFLSPIAGGDDTNAPYFVGDFEPGLNDQSLYQVVSANQQFHELVYNDPTQILTADVFPKFIRNGPDDFTLSVDPGAWQPAGTAGQFVFFPGIDLAIMATGRVTIAGPVDHVDNVVAITISTGSGQPINTAGPAPLSPTGGTVIGTYRAGASSFNRGPIFGEAAVDFEKIQFLPDDVSTHAKPRGELFLWSQVTNPSGSVGRIYVQFVDFNPSNVAGTPNRIHLRQTLLSRVVVVINSPPSGDPPVPLNGFIGGAASTDRNLGAFFSTFGARRMHFIHSTITSGGECRALQVSKAAIPAFISTPSPKVTPSTNRLVTYQSEVTGDLDEDITNALVTWTIQRGSTVAEVLATTPTPGETVTVANPPIDQTIAFGAGFAVLEDGVALDDPTEYTVSDPVAGDITFVGPKPLAGGEVYSCRYPHPDTPATPAHGTVVDASVRTSILGIAQTRISYPDTDALAGHIDLVTAATPT